MGRSKLDMEVRRRLFCEAYVANGLNATEAARAAGYGGTPASLSVYGSRLLKNPLVQAFIAANVRIEGVQPAEVIQLLATHLRGNITDFVTESGEVAIDLERAREGKKLGIVHSLDVTEDTYTDSVKNVHTVRKIKLKLYNAQDAADKLARMLGLYRSKDDEASDASRAPSDQQLLEGFQRYQVPKKLWPHRVLAYYEQQTKAVKSKEAT